MSRELRIGVAALAASATLAVAAPPLGAGLRGTLVVAPIVAATLSLVAGRLGAGALPLGFPALGLGWAVAALASRRLLAGRETDAVLFALFVVGTVACAIRLLPALRRGLAADRGLPASLVIALAFAVGLSWLPWVHAAAEPNGDEPYYLLLADSMARDGDVDLRNQYEGKAARQFTEREIGPQPGDPVGAQGEQWSRHQWTLSALLLPFWLVAGAFGVRAALLLGWAWFGERLLRMLLRTGVSPRAALRAWCAALFSAPLVLYSTAIWVELPAALLVAIALAAWSQESGEESGRSRFVAAGALGFLPLLKLRLLLVALPLGVALFVGGHRPQRRRVLSPLLAVVVGAAAALLANWWTVGRALGVYSPEELRFWSEPVHRLLAGLPGLFFDPAFGLFALGPIWMLALTGVRRAVRSSRIAGAAFVGAIPYLLAVGVRREWYGGWSPPFRYGIVLLPILALALGFAFDRSPTARERTLRWALTLASGAIALTLLIEPGWGISLADGRAHLLDVVAAPFRADLARLLPSFVRMRTASWLAPAGLIVLLIVALRGRHRARRAASARGAAWLLALGAAWIVAAHRVPTRWIEAEDPWIVHQGGALYPPRWIVDRTRFPGGWVMPRGASLALSPVVGGARARITVRVRSGAEDAAPARLELRCGRLPLADWRVDDPAWRETEPREIADCPDAPLVLSVDAEPGARGDAWVVVDRIGFEWR